MSRLAVEGEPLAVYRFADGSTGLIAQADLGRESDCPLNLWARVQRCFRTAPRRSKRVPAVCVPNGAYIILKNIPSAIQQRCGIEEEEGAIMIADSGRDELRFSNGSQIRMEELWEGMPVEVLSLAFTRPILYEEELQIR